MKYTSKLMKEILQSKEAQRIIDYVSPIYSEAYIALWLFEVIGRELDEMSEIVDSFEQQVVPQTATWALKYYEQQYGIVTNESLPIEQRRGEIILKIKTRAPMNPVKLASIIKIAIGVDVRIEENTDKNTFTVVISSIPVKNDEERARKILDEAKPAHLIYRIEYEKSVLSDFYTGGIFTMRKDFTMKQVY